MNDPLIQRAYEAARRWKGPSHPKLEPLIRVVSEQLEAMRGDLVRGAAGRIHPTRQTRARSIFSLDSRTAITASRGESPNLVALTPVPSGRRSPASSRPTPRDLRYLCMEAA